MSIDDRLTPIRLLVAQTEAHIDEARRLFGRWRELEAEAQAVPRWRMFKARSLKAEAEAAYAEAQMVLGMARSKVLAAELTLARAESSSEGARRRLRVVDGSAER